MAAVEPRDGGMPSHIGRVEKLHLGGQRRAESQGQCPGQGELEGGNLWD